MLYLGGECLLWLEPDFSLIPSLVLRFLEKVQFLEDHCCNVPTAKGRGTRYFLLKILAPVGGCTEHDSCPGIISELATGWGEWIYCLDLGHRLAPGHMGQDSSPEPHEIGAHERKGLFCSIRKEGLAVDR